MLNSKNAFTAEEISVFCEQISLLLHSGVSLQEGVEALVDGYKGTKGEAALALLNERMQESGSLADAIAASGAFPAYVTGMIRVGEEAGQLDTVVSALAEHYMREAQIRQAAGSAVRYPLTLMGVMALVILVLVFCVLPVFEQAFKSLSGGVMGASASMMRIGQASGMLIFALMLLMFIAVMAIWLLTKDGKRPQLRTKLIGMVPALARAGRLTAAHRLASVMAMLLRSGFPLESALQLLPDVFEDENEKRSMSELAQRVMDGEAITVALEKTGLFGTLHMRMIRAGFAAGQADAALERVAVLQAQALDDAVARLIAMIEPVLVITLSAMIGAILLSVMMPLAGVLSAMV